MHPSSILGLMGYDVILSRWHPPDAGTYAAASASCRRTCIYSSWSFVLIAFFRFCEVCVRYFLHALAYFYIFVLMVFMSFCQWRLIFVR